jgi:hypothetical protein
LTKEEICNSINNATGELLIIIRSLDEEKLNKTPSEESWTAGQVGDHLLKSYTVVKILNGATKPTDRPPDQKVGEVRNLFLDFNIKMKSPEFIIPSNAPIDKERLLSSLGGRIEQINEVIQTKDLTEICEGFAIPEYGEFTRLEWLYFVLFHTQRHIHQLKDIVQKVKD